MLRNLAEAYLNKQVKSECTLDYTEEVQGWLLILLVIKGPERKICLVI